MMGNNDFNNPSTNYNYYGLSASFLESLGITGPLHNKVFVANVSIVINCFSFSICLFVCMFFLNNYLNNFRQQSEIFFYKFIEKKYNKQYELKRG